MKIECTAAALLLCATSMVAQETPAWSFNERLEIRANYRYSHHEQFQLRFPFPAFFLPCGHRFGVEWTPDSGTHLDLTSLHTTPAPRSRTWRPAHPQRPRRQTPP